jgi:hypothetical protein
MTLCIFLLQSVNVQFEEEGKAESSAEEAWVFAVWWKVLMFAAFLELSKVQ